MLELTAQAPLLRSLAGLFAVMAFCSSVAELHPGLRGEAKRSTRAAVHTWWPVVLTSSACALGGPWVGVPILGLLALGGLREYLALQPAASRDRGVDLAVYLGVPVHLAAVAWRPEAPPLEPLLAWAALAVPLVRLRRVGPQDFAAATGRLVLGPLGLLFALGSAASLLCLAPAPGQPPRGAFALLCFLVMTNDAAQYVAGKALGRTRLAPVVSPKKTWEGLAGGVLATCGVSLLVAPPLLGWGPARAVGVAAVLSVLGLLGDLSVSAWKREAGVKDSGTALPGQGGLLDRLDSLLLAAPALRYALPWLLP